MRECQYCEETFDDQLGKCPNCKADWIDPSDSSNDPLIREIRQLGYRLGALTLFLAMWLWFLYSEALPKFPKW